MTKGIYRYQRELLSEANRDCLAKTKSSLANGKNVVVANTFVSLVHMKPYVELTDEFKCELVVLEAKVILKSVHNLPR